MHNTTFIKRGLLILLLLILTKVAAFAQPNIVWIVSEDNSKHFMQPWDSNGAPVPTIEALANEGLIFHNAFSNTPVCSAARSTLISGCYGPRLGTHYHRNLEEVNFPSDLMPWPQYLREAGYYTTNNAKEDYNLKVSGAWDKSSGKATWRDRKPGQPFFHVQNYGKTHESSLHNIGTSGKTKTDQETVFIPPVHPKTPIFKYSYAKYHDNIRVLDGQIKELVDKLKDDGLLESTFIFYYGDHGGILPGSKGYIYETGLSVPLLVRIPEDYRNQFKLKAGDEVDGFVSFVDFGATVLNIAGVKVPSQMDGVPFIDKNLSLEKLNERNTTFSYADRFDEKYDMVRALRVGKYKYIRNYQPFNFNGLFNEYRYKMEAYKEWRELYDAGKLDKYQASFFTFKQAEELYDIEADPYEINNLAGKRGMKSTLVELREALNKQVKSMPDLSFYPESYLIDNAFDNSIQFGANKKAEISELLAIANLNIGCYKKSKKKIYKALNDANEWKRYWGLVVCSSYLTKDKKMVTKATQLAKEDDNLLVRMRAAEYLALIDKQDPKEVYADIIKQSDSDAELMLILNSAVTLKDGDAQVDMNMPYNTLNAKITKHKDLQRRVDYLNDN